MLLNRRRSSLIVFALCAISFPYAVAPAALHAQVETKDRILLPHEPAPNLGKLKTLMAAYHDCTGKQGCYATDLNQQSDRAIAYLNKRVAKAKPDEKLAMVLDIDETSLSNWEVEKQDDYGYISHDWNAWVDEAKAPAIESTLKLYNDALKHGVAVFFITARLESQRAVTTENLTTAGYKDWKGLALRGPHPPDQTTTKFKSGERKKIVEAGYRILVNVGDQMSDLKGTPKAELSVKLPNPFYYIP